jgi:hypothetical protein
MQPAVVIPDPDTRSPLRWRTREVAGPVVLGVHILTLVGGVGFLLWLNRRLWFFGDDWDFITDRGLTNARYKLFYPHNEHWSTLPILLWRALFVIDGAHHYWVYLLPTLLAHAAVGHVMWRVALRAGVGPWLATTVVTLFLIDGAIAENITWAFQIGFIGSVAFGWWAIYLATAPITTIGRDITATLFLVAGLMCSGIGVTMAAVAGLAILLRRGWQAAIAILILPVVVDLVWLHLIGLESYHTDASASVFHDLTLFAGAGLSNAAEQTLAIPGLGAAAIIALLVWALLQIKAAELRPWLAAPVAGVLGIVVVYLIVAAGRSYGGLDAAKASRYIYVATALAVPGIACALGQLVKKWPVPRLAGIATAGLLCIHLVTSLHIFERAREDQVSADRLRLDAAVELVRSGESLLSDDADPSQSGPLLVSSLAKLVAHGKMDVPAPVPHDVLVIEATVLQTSVTATAMRPLNGALIGSALLTSAPMANGCLTITPTGPQPQIAVRVQPGGTSVALTPSLGGSITVDLSADDPRHPPQNFGQAAAGQTVYANFATLLGTARIVLPANGPSIVCFNKAP